MDAMAVDPPAVAALPGPAEVAPAVIDELAHALSARSTR